MYGPSFAASTDACFDAVSAPPDYLLTLLTCIHCCTAHCHGLPLHVEAVTCVLQALTLGLHCADSCMSHCPTRRPFNPKSAGGAVEKWLIECEAAMRDTIKTVLKESFEAHTRTPRESWMVQWPGQVVLAGEANLLFTPPLPPSLPPFFSF
jgi:hypothetical protein